MPSSNTWTLTWLRRSAVEAVQLALLAVSFLGCAKKTDAPAGVASAPAPAASAQAASPAAPSAAGSVQSVPLGAINRWDDLHRQRDARGLDALYADIVDFYGQRLPKERVLALKTGAFEKAPDFTQSISSVTVTTLAVDEVRAEFTKTWKQSGQEHNTPGVLELRRIDGVFKVTKEADAPRGGGTAQAAAQPTRSVQEATQLCTSDATLNWEACAELAERYESGNGVPKDTARATELAKRACDTGITGMRSPFGRNFCYGFSQRNGINPPLGCCYEGPTND